MNISSSSLTGPPPSLEEQIKSVIEQDKPDVWKYRTLMAASASYATTGRSAIIGETDNRSIAGYWQIPLQQTPAQYTRDAIELAHAALSFTADA